MVGVQQCIDKVSKNGKVFRPGAVTTALSFKFLIKITE